MAFPELNRRTAAALMLTLLAAAGLALAVENGSESPTDKPRKPRVRLLANPAVGFTPVTVTLTGELTGVRPDDPDFCHAAITWVTIPPGRSEESARIVREDPVCRHSEEESRVRMAYTRTVSLYRPGTYLFRLRIESKENKRVQSGYAKVRVLRVQ